MSWYHCISKIESGFCEFRSVQLPLPVNYVKHLMDSQFSTSKKPSTIQNGRTFFKPLTHVSMWCNVNGLLSDVEKANALVPVQKHLLIYLFGWNYIVDWSLFLVFERDKQNICYHTPYTCESYPYHLHTVVNFDRVFDISRVTWLNSRNDSVDLILLNFCWNWTWNFIDYKS